MPLLRFCGSMPPSSLLLVSCTNRVLIRSFIKSKLYCVIIWLSMVHISCPIVYIQIVNSQIVYSTVWIFLCTMYQWIYLRTVSYILIYPKCMGNGDMTQAGMVGEKIRDMKKNRETFHQISTTLKILTISKG